MQALLRRNRDHVLSQIADAARACGRQPEEIELLAVTKSVPSAVAQELFDLGQTALGENRADVLERKVEALSEAGRSPTWHFIGHIQRNKAARVVRAADVIHSVHSDALLEALARHAAAQERCPSIYLQVKLADEDAKSGLAPEEVPRVLERAAALDSIRPVGLMTMAPMADDEDTRRAAARRTFEALAELASGLDAERFAGEGPRLSMGMSGDFAEAIAAGAHVVRIGTALFSGLDRPSADEGASR